MTFAALINVKDDLELLRANLAYHRTVGVGGFLLCARGSSPASLDALRALAEAPDVALWEQDLLTLDPASRAFQDRRLTALRTLRTHFPARWVMAIDVDEFWVPRTGQLAATQQLQHANLLRVPRFNAAPAVGQGPALLSRLTAGEVQAVEILTARTRLSERALEADPSARWVEHRVAPKLLTCVDAVTTVKPGFHDLEAGVPLRRAVPDDLAILHVPFTTPARFRQKVEDIHAYLDRLAPTLAEAQAWHWRRWAAVCGDEAALRREFDRQFFSPAHLDALRAARAVLRLDAYFVARAAQTLAADAAARPRWKQAARRLRTWQRRLFGRRR